MSKLPLEDDAIQYSQLILVLFLKAEGIESALEPLLDPLEGSPLFMDDSRCPDRTVSGYAYGQLSVAAGCISSLKQMIVHESDDGIYLKTNPFGAYALLRNALDAAAVAMWLLEPADGVLRIKRRMMLAVEEVDKSAAFRETTGQPSTRAERSARLKELARLAGLEGWDPLSKDGKLPSTTQILRDLETLHSNKVIPWLAAWQLASGHAHGK